MTILGLFAIVHTNAYSDEKLAEALKNERLLKQLGYVPECVLMFCNADRNLMRQLGE